MSCRALLWGPVVEWNDGAQWICMLVCRNRVASKSAH